MKTSRKRAASPKAKKAPESGPKLRAEDPGVGKPLDVDVEKHLEWLETGKGKPWPRASRS
ncbi:MAG: hypothetical protein ACRELY_23520 [Polyangiaceae bacterium]